MSTDTQKIYEVLLIYQEKLLEMDARFQTNSVNRYNIVEYINQIDNTKKETARLEKENDERGKKIKEQTQSITTEVNKSMNDPDKKTEVLKEYIKTQNPVTQQIYKDYKAIPQSLDYHTENTRLERTINDIDNIILQIKSVLTNNTILN